MNENRLRKWVLIAEVISAAAVVVTLAFLALQMKENTNSLQAQTFQELMRDSNNWRASISDTANIELRAKRRKNGFDSLTETEQLQLRLQNLVLWGILESAFYANKREVLGKDEWVRFKVSICRNRKRDDEVWNYEGISSFDVLLTPSFVDFINNECN